MSTLLARLATIATLGVAALALTASQVSAQTGTFQATPSSGPTGTVISISSVSPCVPPSSVTFARISLSQGSTVLATGNFSVSSSGAWSGKLTVSAQARSGAATLGGDCIASPQAEGSLLHYQDVSFTVTSSPISGATTTPTGMPWGGSRPYEAGVGGLGLGLIVLGYLQRRRVAQSLRS